MPNNIVYSGDCVKIVKVPSRGIFQIQFSYSNPALINSLIKTRIIQGATATDDYKVVQFKAASVQTLKQFQAEMKAKTGTDSLPINIAAQIMTSLATQLKHLISEESRTILGYAPENIIIINGKKSAFLDSELISEIEDNMSQVICPFSSKDFFVSPEMLKINALPSYVHYKTAYFSLACLIIHVLAVNDELYNQYIQDGNPDRLMNAFKGHRLKDTKLYWLLSRCVVDDPVERCILFI